MDSTGVPHKINRHVYKAVNHLGRESSNFTNIYHYVKVCTRNLKPVPHLKETVQKSLNNLKATGIVKMDARNKYKLKGKFATMRDVPSSRFADSSSNENISPPPTRTRKRRRTQIYSDEEEDDDVHNKNSLINLKGANVAKKTSGQRNKLKPKFPNLKDNQTDRTDDSSSNENLSPQSRKRHPADSGEEEEFNDTAKNVSKRFRASSKNLSKTRVTPKKLPKHRKYEVKTRSSSKVKPPVARTSSKANIIYKNVENVVSDGHVNNEPNHNDKDLNSDCETIQSKEAFDKRTEAHDDEAEEEKQTNDVKESKSVISKNAPSHRSGDSENELNVPDDADVTDIIDEPTNINNERTNVDGTLANIRRYNYNYLN